MMGDRLISGFEHSGRNLKMALNMSMTMGNRPLVTAYKRFIERRGIAPALEQTKELHRRAEAIQDAIANTFRRKK